MVFSAWFYKGEIRLATLSTELRDFFGQDICPHWNITRRCLCHGRKGIWPLLTNKERVKCRRPYQSLSCLLATKCKCSVLGTAVTLGLQLMCGTVHFLMRGGSLGIPALLLRLNIAVLTIDVPSLRVKGTATI